jgi:hypothetical protein
MADIDVIALIFESFGLVRARYRDVAFPLMVLLLLSSAGNFGGSSLSDLASQGGAASGDYAASPLASALSDSGGPWAGATGIALPLIALLVAFAFAITTASLSAWFYACEHFYAILRRKKAQGTWEQRMARHVPRAIVLALFEFFLFGAFAAAIIACFAAALSAGLPAAIALFAATMLLAMLAALFIIPAWAYYAMDSLPFFTSIDRSITLVRGNMAHFLIYAAIFFLLNLGVAAASVYACCLSFLIVPLFAVFFGLTARVTLLKMKLSIEKQRATGG